jgi:hypothetical protein
MRVTIEHREQTSGALANHKDSYIDCRVEFNEEERAIVKARDLYREGFSIRTSTPLPSKTQFFGTNVMRAGGFILAIIGIMRWIYEGLAHTPTVHVGGLMALLGAVLFIWGSLRTRKEDKRFESSEQEITVKQLLGNPSFTVHAWNPAAAKGIEETIRENLAALKSLIQNSAELQTKQTFEL